MLFYHYCDRIHTTLKENNKPTIHSTEGLTNPWLRSGVMMMWWIGGPSAIMILLANDRIRSNQEAPHIGVLGYTASFAVAFASAEFIRLVIDRIDDGRIRG